MLQSIAFQNCMNASKKIQIICEPLFKMSQIEWFGYSQEYFNGSKILLANSLSWLENNFSKSYFKLGPMRYVDFYQNEFMLWDHFRKDEQIEDAKKNFNIDHGITFAKKQENFIELFHFAATCDNHEIINWYINHLHLLKRFCHFYTEQMQSCHIKLPSITNQEDALIIQNEFAQLIALANNQQSLVDINDYWHAGHRGNNIILSKREVDLAKLLLKGMTAKEIAKNLGLSPRTIEFYMIRMKKKFNCNYKAALIQEILKVGFLDEFSVF